MYMFCAHARIHTHTHFIRSDFVSLRKARHCHCGSLKLASFKSAFFKSCVILFLCFSVLLALRFSRLGKRKLISVLFVRLFDLCLFGFVYFLFLLVSGKGWGLWLWHSLDFVLTFFKPRWYILLTVLRRWSRCWSYFLFLCGLFYEVICFKSCLVLFCICVFPTVAGVVPSGGRKKSPRTSS